MASWKNNVVGMVTLAVWALAAGLGMAWLNRYSAAPGEPGDPPAHWPQESRVARHRGRATLVLLAHPECPCTRASLGELEILMARSRAPLAVYALFVDPGGSVSLETTDLWKLAAAIPGVKVLRDRDGSEATRFRLSTSGHVLLYDGQGQLQFSGGITKSRGHSGDNAGRDAIVAFLNRGAAPWARTSVFGCSLSNTSSLPQQTAGPNRGNP